MANGIYITGWEHGLGTPVISGGGLASVVTGTGMSVQSTYKHLGGFSLKGVGTGGETYVTIGFPVATQQASAALVFYFMWHTLPDVDMTIARIQTNAGSTARINFDPADQKIYGRYVTLGSKVNQVLSADTWYRIDVKLDVSANPSKMWYNVDGVGEQYAEYAQSSTTFNGIRFGFVTSVTAPSQGECYWDDVFYSYDMSSYPIGAIGVAGLRPSGDGTHNNAANIMEDSAGNDIDGSTYYAYDKLDENPWVSTPDSDYVRQAGNGSGNYCEVLFEDISQTEILGAIALLQYASATATGNNGGCVIIDEDSTATTLWGASGALADYSEITAFYKKIWLPTPAGGWDQAAVNALKCRFGYSTDADPDPYWLAVILEVAYRPVVNILLDTAASSVSGVVLTVSAPSGAVTIPFDVASLAASGVSSRIGIPIGQTVAVDVEENDFSDFTIVYNYNGQMTVAAGAALNGTNYGISILLTGAGANSMWGEKIFSPSNIQPNFRARFFFDPNGSSWSSSSNDIFYIVNSDGQYLLRVYVYEVGGVKTLRYVYYSDGYVAHTYPGTFEVSDEEHVVEVWLSRGGAVGDRAGLRFDGGPSNPIGGWSNQEHFYDIETVRFGWLTGGGTHTGTIYLDELIANDTGDEIDRYVDFYNVAWLSANGQSLTVVTSNTIPLDTAIATASGQSLTVQEGEVTIPLTTASTLTNGISIAVVEGTVTIPLVTASITAVGQPITVVKGGVTIPLGTGTTTSNGIPLEVIEGSVAISLNTATSTSNGVSLTVGAGLPKIIYVSWVEMLIPAAPTTGVSLNTASITANGVVVVISTTTTILLDVANVLASGEVLDVLPGEIVLSFNVAQVTADSQIIVIAGEKITTLNVGLVIANGKVLDIITDEQVNLSTAISTASGITLTILPGEATISINTANIIVDGVILAVETITNISLNIASISANGVILTVLTGEAIIILGVATSIANGIVLTVMNISGISTPLNTAIISCSGIPIVVLAGEATISLNTGLANANGIASLLIAGEALVLLQSGSIVSTGIVLVVSAPLAKMIQVSWIEMLVPALISTPILLSTGTIQATGQMTSLALGEVIILLSNGLVSISGQNLLVLGEAISIPLGSGITTSNGIAFTIVVGDVILILDTASSISNSLGFSIVPGEKSTLISTGTIVAFGKVLDVITEGMILLQTSVMSTLGQSILIVPGEVSLVFSVSSLTSSGQMLGVLTTTGILLFTGSIVSQGVVIALIIGEVNVLFNVGLLTSSGQTIAIIPGEVSLVLQVGSSVLEGQPISVLNLLGIYVYLTTGIILANGIVLDIRITVDLPECRTFQILPDDRLYLIEEDLRVLEIPYDLRILYVDYESRVFNVTEEYRQLELGVCGDAQ